MKKIYRLEVKIFGKMNHRIPLLVVLRASVRRSQMPLTGPAERIFKWGGLTRTRRREPTRGSGVMLPRGEFEILFF